MLEEFINHKNETGKTSVSRKHNTKLAYWIANQRKYYRMDKLTKERIEKLLSIGFVFDCE